MATKAAALNLCAGALLIGQTAVTVSSPVRPEKPNVIGMLNADPGWQDLKCYDIDEHSFLVSFPQVDDVASALTKKEKSSGYAPDTKVVL